MHILFVRMVKFQFLAQFIVNQLPLSDIFSLITPFALVYNVRLSCVTWGRKIEEIYFLCTLQGVFHSPVLFRDEE